MDQGVEPRAQPSELEVGLEPLDVIAKGGRVEPRDLAVGAGIEVAARASEQEGRGVSEARARKLGASVAAALDRSQHFLRHDEGPAKRPDLVGIGGRAQVSCQQFVGRDDSSGIDVERLRDPLAVGFADAGTATREPDGTQHGRRSAVLERRHLARVLEHRSSDVGRGLHLEPTGDTVDRQFDVRLEAALTHD